MKYRNMPVLIQIIKRLPPIVGKLNLVILVLATNGWIFQKKPQPITLAYWILPGVVLLATLLCCLNRTAKTQRYYNDATGGADEVHPK